MRPLACLTQLTGKLQKEAAKIMKEAKKDSLLLLEEDTSGADTQTTNTQGIAHTTDNLMVLGNTPMGNNHLDLESLVGSNFQPLLQQVFSHDQDETMDKIDRAASTTSTQDIWKPKWATPEFMAEVAPDDQVATPKSISFLRRME
jgi:hypothetical protein